MCSCLHQETTIYLRLPRRDSILALTAGFQKQMEGVICVSVGAFALVIIVALTVYWLGIHHRHRREPHAQPSLPEQTIGWYNPVSNRGVRPRMHVPQGGGLDPSVTVDDVERPAREGRRTTATRGGENNLPSYGDVLVEYESDRRHRPQGSHHPSCNSRMRRTHGERRPRCNCALLNPIEVPIINKSRPNFSETSCHEITIPNPFVQNWLVNSTCEAGGGDESSYSHSPEQDGETTQDDKVATLNKQDTSSEDINSHVAVEGSTIHSIRL